jgi:rhodanese-related sulfurtransferase
MKNKLAILIATSTLLWAFSCGEAEESADSTDNTLRIEKEDVDEMETNLQIIENLDNASFNDSWSEKGGLLIDVRTPEEFKEGAIEGAQNMNFLNGDFELAIDTLDVSVPIFIYCQGGGRSGNARDLLAEKGFIEVYNLKDGYGNWTE